jgi:hypothetical protein
MGIDMERAAPRNAEGDPRIEQLGGRLDCTNTPTSPAVQALLSSASSAVTRHQVRP